MTGKSEIKVDCPKCLASLQVPVEKGGFRIDCPECGHSLQVPDAQAAGNSLFDDLFDSTDDNVVSKETSNEPETPIAAKGDNEGFPDLKSFEDIEIAIEKHQAAEEAGEELGLAPVETRGTSTLPTVDHNESLPAEMPEIESDPLESLDDPSLDLDSVDLFGNPNNDPGEQGSGSARLDLSPIGTEDPFAEDSDKPLTIDGISPTVRAEDIYGIKCKICDTRIHVNIAHNGENIQCPICYSDVKVDIDSSQRDMEQQSLKLQDETSQESSTINPNKDVKVTQRDMDKLPEFDDTPLKLAPLEPDTPRTPEAGDRDLLQPVIKDSGPAETMPAKGKSTSKMEPGAAVKKKRKKKEKKTAEYGTKQYWEDKVVEVQPEGHDVPEILKSDSLSFKDVVGWMSKGFTSPELIYRTLIAIVMMGFAYTMYDIFYNAYYDEEMAKFTRILSMVLPCLAGGVALMVGLLALFTTCSMVFQNSTNGIAKSEDWPGFSFSDWLGPLLLFLFSFWLGSLPGGLFGALFAVGFSQNVWIVVFASLSAFILSPIFYLCVAYNGSAFNVFAPEVFKSLRSDDISWLSYLPLTMAAWVGFLAGTLILLIPTFVFSGLGAAVQVVMLISFASICGLHTGRVLYQMQKKSG